MKQSKGYFNNFKSYWTDVPEHYEKEPKDWGSSPLKECDILDFSQSVVRKMYPVIYGEYLADRIGPNSLRYWENEVRAYLWEHGDNLKPTLKLDLRTKRRFNQIALAIEICGGVAEYAKAVGLDLN